jgi:hypothetical protein
MLFFCPLTYIIIGQMPIVSLNQVHRFYVFSCYSQKIVKPASINASRCYAGHSGSRPGQSVTTSGDSESFIISPHYIFYGSKYPRMRGEEKERKPAEAG